MNIKICISIILALTLSIILTPVISAANTVTISDGTNDIEKYNELSELVKDGIEFDDIDIEEISFTQDDEEVTVSLKLVDGGVLSPTADRPYTLVLFTASPNIVYLIFYLGAEAEYDGQTFEFLITNLVDGFYDVKDRQVSDNQFSVTFDLANKNERCLSLNAFVDFEVDNYSYRDSVPDQYLSLDEEDFFTIQPLAGGPYEASTGQNIVFQGDLETGNPSDYEWVWLIDDTEDYLYGQNPTHKFNFAGNYTGTLYVYNDQGEFGFEYFTVEVSGKDITSSGGGDSDSGSGLMMFIILIAIIVIIGIAVVVIVLRR